MVDQTRNEKNDAQKEISEPGVQRSGRREFPYRPPRFRPGANIKEILQKEDMKHIL